MNIRISPISNKINNQNSRNVSFGALRLYPVKLTKYLNNSDYRIINGYFSKLDTSDFGLIEDILPLWRRSKYGEEILNQYLYNFSFADRGAMEQTQFMIESEAYLDGKDRVKALANIFRYDNSITLDLLQSKSAIDKDKELCGAGTMMLYGLSKYAQELNLRNISLHPLPRVKAWYEKLGFEKVQDSIGMVLPANKFKQFQSQIEEKWFKG